MKIRITRSLQYDIINGEFCPIIYLQITTPYFIASSLNVEHRRNNGYRFLFNKRFDFGNT